MRNELIRVFCSVVGEQRTVSKCGRRQCRRWRMWDVGFIGRVKRELRLGRRACGSKVLWKRNLSVARR